ncbi:MAG: DUF1588 domain-containing protein [Myxococcota bacterium]
MRRVGLCLTFAAASACTEEVSRELPPVEVSPGRGALARLTEAQLGQALAAIFGPGVVAGGPVEPDLSAAGLRQVGAARTSLSEWGVEQYEGLAHGVARQVLSEDHRGWLPCPIDQLGQASCRDRAIRFVAERAWRRPLEPQEMAALDAVFDAAVAALPEEGAKAGLQYVISAILQSPDFLYRFEVGRVGDELDAFELATRLAFFLWNAPADDALWRAAVEGALPRDLVSEAERMMASPRFETGTRAFFEDLYHLYALDEVSKDPEAFLHFSSELRAEAREESLRFLIDLLVTKDGDYRDVFRAERTFASRRLAALYGVKATAREGFGEVALPPEGGRRGILGHAGFLMLSSHPIASSATLRGKFIREVFLCDVISAPPADVNTALPEPTGSAVTLRERVQEHLVEPSCSGCHNLMDPLGLGLEQFDALGRFRSLDRGAPIDPSGDLDGVSFGDAWELGDVLAEHPKIPGCIVRSVFRYALSREETTGERQLLELLTNRFVERGHTWRGLVLDIVASPSFRRVSEVER